MKDFCLGFCVCLSLCSALYIVWEHNRHISVVVREVPIPVSQDTSDHQWIGKIGESDV